MLKSVYKASTAYEATQERLSVEPMPPFYEAQPLTYLKVTGCRIGYLINFNVKHLKDEIKCRMSNSYPLITLCPIC